MFKSPPEGRYVHENIIASQRQLLRSWRIRVRQIGYDMAQKGISE
jgi:hypothetical protein